jgi:osomolarity two-component system response regulator SSK1
VSSQALDKSNNDQPVNFVWFERKVKEWGCMQALIDYDGWRKWKESAQENGLKDGLNPKMASLKKKKAERAEGKAKESSKESSEDTLTAAA